MRYIKTEVLTIFTFLGGAISYILGGIDASLIALFIFMVIDTIMGFTNALLFNKSKKTKTGRASSSAGIKGITKKFMMIFIVVVANQVDIVMGTTFVRDGVVIGYAAMEALSIVENAANMGVPIPKILRDALEIMNKSNEEEKE